MVNSGYYLPESLMARYPEKKFIGLPAKPEEFERFRSLYPEYRAIVWHEEFSVQDELLRYLIDSGRYGVTSRWASDYGDPFHGPGAEMRLLLGLMLVLAVASGADTLGRGLRRLLFRGKALFADATLDEIVSIALGLIVLSHALFIMTLVHMISRGSLWAFAGGCAALGLPAAFRLAPRCLGYARSLRPGKDAWIFAFMAYFVFMAALATLPANERDELIYHLEVPQRILANGGDLAFRDNFYGYFPHFGEMFFLLGLGTAGETAAKLFHLLSGLLLAGVIARAATAWMDRKRALLAAALFLTVPSVAAMMSWAYVDLTFVLYAVLALLFVLEFIKRRGLYLVVPAGIFLGAAASVKYTGLQLAALTICALALFRLKDKTLPLVRPALILGGLCVLVAGPYYARSWLLAGWPLMPFATPGFSLRPGINWDPGRAGLYLRWLQTFGAAVGPGAFLASLAAPVLVFIKGQFDNVRWFDGVLGPVFLLVPFLWPRKKAGLEMRFFGVFSLLFLFYWTYTTKQVRFLLPVVPFLCLLLAGALDRRSKKGLAVAVVGLLMLFNVYGGARRVAKERPFAFWFGGETRAQYLAKQIDVYPMYAKANELLGPADKLYLVHMRNLGYLLDRKWEGDFVFERTTLERALAGASAAGDVEAFFRGRGVTHLMINTAPLYAQAGGLEARDKALFEEFLGTCAEPLVIQGAFGLYRLSRGPNY